MFDWGLWLDYFYSYIYIAPLREAAYKLQCHLAVLSYEGIFALYNVSEAIEPILFIESSWWDKFWVALFLSTPWYFLIFFIIFFYLHNKYLTILVEQTALSLLTIVNFLDSEAEQEYGALEDYLSYLLTIVLFIAWYYFFLILSHYILEKYLNWILLTWGGLVLFTFCIPAFTFKSFGLAFITYIRGSAKSKLIIVEVVLDLIACLVVFIRFFVQNIRFVLIFIALFELYEFIFLNLHFSHTITQCLDFWSWYYGAYKYMTTERFFFNLIWSLLYYFYYVIHLTLLYVTQVGIFLALSFWLYFFLFTSFVFEKAERVFFFKKYLVNPYGTVAKEDWHEWVRLTK